VAYHVALIPPAVLTKDLLARFLCWHMQEQAFGGLDPATAKILDGFASGERPVAERRLKLGTVLVREYQGQRHTVTVVAGGYLWGEATYPSLSTIARAITGTAWNGPRFFGLRTSANSQQGDEPGRTGRYATAGAHPCDDRSRPASPQKEKRTRRGQRS
jgi:hypothetical protein